MAEEEILSKGDIDDIDDICFAVISIPEWNDKKVRVRCATAAEWDAYTEALDAARTDENGNRKTIIQTNARATLAVKCLVDKAGQRLYADKDAAKFGQKSAGAITRIWSKIRELSFMAPGSSGAVVKNSEGGESENSPSSSPAT